MPMPEPAPVGLLGGTFDPVHLGHLRLAEEAREALGLERVLWTPAGRPPHRHAPREAGGHRLAMVRLAVAGNDAFAVDDAEVRCADPSYTVVSLERLRARVGAAQPLVLLMGADAFLGLPGWHRWRDLFGLAHIAVASRPGYPVAAAAVPAALAAELAARRQPDAGVLARSAAGSIVEFGITPLAVSASDIRARIACGRSVRYLIPDSVLDYIGRHSLYAVGTNGPE
jgi:nicotinate-nucleotide adenylyltransferase